MDTNQDKSTRPTVSSAEINQIFNEIKLLRKNLNEALRNLALSADTEYYENARMTATQHKLYLLAAYQYYFGEAGRDLIIEMFDIIETNDTTIDGYMTYRYRNVVEANRLLMTMPIRSYDANDYEQYTAIDNISRAAAPLIIRLMPITGSHTLGALNWPKA